MGKARAILKRRKAVGNIRKITRTMQLIATARFQGAYKRAVNARPYTEGIMQLVRELAGEVDLDHPLLRENAGSNHSALVVITSNRGFCGGYNGAAMRAALAHIQAREKADEKVDLHVCGKKGIAHFRFLARPRATEHIVFEDKPKFAEVEAMAESLMSAYARGLIDSACVTYTRFESTARQFVETIRLLPIEQPDAQSRQAPGTGLLYEFSPPVEELLGRLLPQTVKVRLYQCFIDAAVSEQVARMVAMKAATDAAGSMIRSLTQQYNRARQSQITLELLDIVGGANALK